MEKLSIDLSRDMAQSIRRAVDDGSYASSDDVVADALRLWRQRQRRLDDVRSRLDAAAADPARFSDDEVTSFLDGLLVEVPPTR